MPYPAQSYLSCSKSLYNVSIILAKKTGRHFSRLRKTKRPL
jgi:hypothetical protein